MNAAMLTLEQIFSLQTVTCLFSGYILEPVGGQSTFPTTLLGEASIRSSASIDKLSQIVLLSRWSRWLEWVWKMLICTERRLALRIIILAERELLYILSSPLRIERKLSIALVWTSRRASTKLWNVPKVQRKVSKNMTNSLMTDKAVSSMISLMPDHVFMPPVHLG